MTRILISKSASLSKKNASKQQNRVRTRLGTMPRKSPTQGSNGPARPRYRVVVIGAGIEEFDLASLKEAIRSGHVNLETEIAPPGADGWKRARELPELAPFLREPHEKPSRSDAPATSLEPMVHRVVAGLTYPLAGLEFVVLLGIAVLMSIPFASLLAVPIATVYILAIVRSSSEGRTRMPATVDTSDIPGVLVLWLRASLVLLVALLPVVAWVSYWYWTSPRKFSPDSVRRLVPTLAATGLLFWSYFPACAATIAVWDSVTEALNPAVIGRVIRTLGRDYWIAAAVGGAAIVAARFSGIAFDRSLPPIPILSALPHRVLLLWSEFYCAHLVGYAVHRHIRELGWD